MIGNRGRFSSNSRMPHGHGVGRGHDKVVDPGAPQTPRAARSSHETAGVSKPHDAVSPTSLTRGGSPYIPSMTPSTPRAASRSPAALAGNRRRPVLRVLYGA